MSQYDEEKGSVCQTTGAASVSEGLDKFVQTWLINAAARTEVLSLSSNAKQTVKQLPNEDPAFLLDPLNGLAECVDRS